MRWLLTIAFDESSGREDVLYILALYIYQRFRLSTKPTLPCCAIIMRFLSSYYLHVYISMHYSCSFYLCRSASVHISRYSSTCLRYPFCISFGRRTFLRLSIPKRHLLLQLFVMVSSLNESYAILGIHLSSEDEGDLPWGFSSIIKKL